MSDCLFPPEDNCALDGHRLCRGVLDDHGGCGSMPHCECGMILVPDIGFPQSLHLHWLRHVVHEMEVEKALGEGVPL